MELEITLSAGETDSTRSGSFLPQLANIFLAPQIHNYMELIHSIALVDLGDFRLDNVLVNTSTVLAGNNAFSQTFVRPGHGNWTQGVYTRGAEQKSDLYHQFSQMFEHGRGGLTLPMVDIDPGPPVLETLYLCREWVPKSVGSAFVSVLVATITMMTTAYTVLIFLGSLWVKRHDPEGKIFSREKGGCTAY